MTKELQEKLADAQMVLVGIGKEMELKSQEVFGTMKENLRYAKLLEQAEERKEADAIKQYLQLSWMKNHPDERRQAAYGQLAALLSGKNYFIVTLCTDDLILEAGLDEGRIVAPCGGFRALQCPALQCPTLQSSARKSSAEGEERTEDAARQESEAPQAEGCLYTDPAMWEGPLSRIEDGTALSEIAFPRCPKCGSVLAFNRISTPGYLEEGYLPQWKKYQKWLQGTLNHRLCILELGAGMEYPSVIRFPFERVAFFNQKAELFRVHSRLYQMPAELKGRGVSIQADPADFLLENAAQENIVS